MGTSAYVKTFFGVEAPRSVFFTATNETRQICSRNSTHPIGTRAKFCGDCGAKITQQTLEVPTPAFQAFCDARGSAPDEAFAELQNYELGGWEWCSDDGTGQSCTIKLNRVQACNHSENNEFITALSTQLGRAHESDTDKTLAYSAEDLTKLEPAFREIAGLLGISATPKLYVQVYFSY